VKVPERVFVGTAFPCEVVVTNNTSSARDVEAMLQLPEGWTRVDGRNDLLRFVGVPSKGRQSVAVTCVADEAAAAESVEVTALVIATSRRAKVRVSPPRASYRASKATGIVVDGDLADWSGRELVRLGETAPEKAKYTKHPYGGDADLSCEVAFAWDEEFLYVSAKVRDDCHVNPVRSTDVWKGDAIQFALRTGGPADKADDSAALQEFAVGADDDGAFVQTWNNQTQYISQAKAASQVSGDTLTMEFAVPWKLLGLEPPQAGASIGASFVVPDNDSPDISMDKLMAMDGYLEWTPGIFYGKDPASFAWLILAE
jgi:hypothetical protein